MLPFTLEQFLNVFVDDNNAVWPAQVLAYLLALVMTALVIRPSPNRRREVAAGLAATEWQIEHELRKYELALVHDGLGREPAKNRQFGARRRSNRDQTQISNLTTKSLTYDVLL